MKKHALLILILCGSATLRGVAQETPPIPPPVPPAPPVAPVAPTRPTLPRTRTFFGVEVGPIPDALSEQLNLPEGFGVLVQYVVPGSAADAAGVKANDILKTLDGQIVTSADHLAVLVRSFKEGQEIALLVLHKGLENKLTASMQKRADRPSSRDWLDGQRDFDDAFGPAFHFDSDDQLKQLHAVLEKSQAQTRAATARAMERSKHALDEAREQTARAFGYRTDFGHARVVLRDPTGRIELRVVRGKHTLRVRDEKGETVFEGPINTPEQRKAIPANVLLQVEALEHEQETAFPKESDDADE